ncbi:MAG: DUF4159 domain-containing protein [Proteobacteria bacterium]|nr:DUF4159 domain-containing protein [Pseudomonadota bacterium]
MLNLGPLAILNPAILAALVVLPAVWFRVRALPPEARKVAFPPILLLRGLEKDDSPPDRTPWWVLAIRLLILTLIILALARPVLNPGEKFTGDGAILIVVDNGWEAASRWAERTAALRGILNKAERENRPVILLPTASPGTAPGTISARQALERLPALQAMPWSPDHRQSALLLGGLEPSQAIWLSDGLKHEGSDEFRQRLDDLTFLEIRTDTAARHAFALHPPGFSGLDIEISAVRPPRAFAENISVEVLGRNGQRIGELRLDFAAGTSQATGVLRLPQRSRNEISRVQIAGHRSAGATILLDWRSGRPLVGITENGGLDTAPPLTTPAFYLSRALEPYSALVRGDVTGLMDQEATLIFMADYAGLTPGQETALLGWVAEGGVLVSFASAQPGALHADLLPVRVRSGDRATGGALTWDQPKKILPFPEGSPFFGIAIPDDVTVSRQLLAAPEPDLARKIWARLEDGTPIVTADTRGEGWLVLFHTTANAEWSNLAHSGLFVELLRHILPLARGGGASDLAAGPALLAPDKIMTGTGELVAAPPGTGPISREVFSTVTAGPDTPPGLYGPPEGTLALNLVAKAGPISDRYSFTEIDRDHWKVIDGLSASQGKDFGGPLLVAAILVAMADILIGLWLRGLLTLRPARSGTAVCLALAVTASFQGQPVAQNLDEEFAVAATSQTRLAWVSTGSAARDNVIESGLKGLGRVLRIRTAVSLGPPMMVDPETDPLNLFPLIYWPVTTDSQLSEAGAARLSAYLRKGGMVLFDSGIGDPTGISLGLQRPEAQESLRRILENIDLPQLVPVDSRHVLSKSYYLLDRFPGRIQGRQIWVERGTDRDGESVSAVVIGGGDWASAWAIDPLGMPLVRSLPGGEWQRELAYRFGVNLVMYALTGTYKDDQLHLEALMNRLGE